jgi:hypothetical protein
MAKYLHYGYSKANQKINPYFFLVFADISYQYRMQGLCDILAKVFRNQKCVNFEPLDVLHFFPIKVGESYYQALKSSQGVYVDIAPIIWEVLKDVINWKEMKFWAENFPYSVLGAYCGECLMVSGIKYYPKN